jgi:uncharacterized protein YqeY
MNDRLQAELKTAMLARDALRVSVLKSLKSALANEQIAKGHELSDEEVVAVLKRQAKQRDEAAAGFTEGGAQDRAEKEIAEKVIIDEFLPEQLSESAVVAVIDEVVSAAGDGANQGQIIGQVMAQLKGQADGAVVARLVRERLN